MSSGSQFSRSKSGEPAGDADLFVQGIPIDLDRNGLINIFVKAGPVEMAKIVQPKNPNHTITYGFVRFKHRTAAATAIEMFDGYKLGNKTLSVRFSTQSAGATSRTDLNKSMTRSTTGSSVNNDGWEDVPRDNRYKSQTKLETNGVEANQNDTAGGSTNSRVVKNENGCEFNLDRHFAKFLYSMRPKGESSEVVHPVRKPTPAPKPQPVPAKKEETKLIEDPGDSFQVGKKYPVNITHVNTPSNFFVQLVSNVSKTGNLMNNLDNYYRNELGDDDIKKQYTFEVNDLCAGYHDSFWYRGRVVDKSPEKRTYHLSIIDFGDIQELSFENVTILSDEFCSAERGSIRCKLYNLRPPLGHKEWPESTSEILKNLSTPDDPIFAHVVARNEFQGNSYIFSINLIFGEDSVNNYLIEHGHAIEDKKEDEREQNHIRSEISSSSISSHASNSSKNPKSILKETKENNYVQNEAPKQQSERKPLGEQDINVVKPVGKPPQPEQKPVKPYLPKIDQVKLQKSRNYIVTLSYFDDTLVDPNFYLSIFENAAKITELSEYLQREPTKEQLSKNKFTYINKLEDLKIGDVLEALFDVDNLWYRVSVRRLSVKNNKLKIYFLDYGNSQILDAQSEPFKNSKLLRFRNCYDDEEETRVFSLKYQAIKCNYILKGVKSKSSMEEFIDKLQSFEDIESGFQIKVTQILENDFEEDKFPMTSVTHGIDFSDEPLDTNTTEVEENLSRMSVSDKEVSSILEEVNNISVTNVQTLNDKSETKRVSHEAQTSQTKIIENEGNISRMSVSDKEVSSILEEVNNVSVTNVKSSFTKYEPPLDKQEKPSIIEDEKIPSALNESPRLKIGTVYPSKVVFAETEFYIQLVEDAELFTELETSLVDQNVNNYISVYKQAQFKIGDFVLAKFYFNPDNMTEFSWYRAIVTKFENKKYEVFYIDYGNTLGDLVINDLIRLPSEFNLKKFPQFAHLVRLNGIDIDLETHEGIIAEFFESETFLLKIIDTINENGFKYTAEFWSNDESKCLNSLLNSNYKPLTNEQILKILEQSIDYPIESYSLLDDYNQLVQSNNNNQVEMKIEACGFFMENLQKSIYFCMKKDIPTRKNLENEMNEFYSIEANLNSTKVDNPFGISEYYALLSQESWYRTQIKKIDSNTNEALFLFIDYGYEEALDLTLEENQSRIRLLDERFLQIKRLGFGTQLLVPTAKSSKNVEYQAIKFEEDDESELSNVFTEFLSANDDEFIILILSQLENQKLNETIFFSDEPYFGIELFNLTDMCLNEMIVYAKEENNQKKIKAQKLPKPADIKLTIKDIPSQRDNLKADQLDQQFLLFARRIDLFYVFNDATIRLIQHRVQEICHLINEEQDKYLVNENADLPEIGDLVFGKYDDDQAWYRCKITNVNHKSGKYELFFIDFGNTEVCTINEILYGWDEQHVSVFREYAPQAYKCRLYGLKPADTNSSYKDEQNSSFKQYISNKLFNAKFIKYSKEEDMYEICLNDITTESNDNNKSLQAYLINKKIAEFSKFNEILTKLETKEQLEFYIEMLNNLNIKKKEFL